MKQKDKDIPGSRWSLHAYDEHTETNIGNKGIFDELAVGDWLHIEQMDERCWWMRIGDADITVNIEEDGTPRVNVQRAVHGKRHGATSYQPFEKIGRKNRNGKR